MSPGSRMRPAPRHRFGWNMMHPPTDHVAPFGDQATASGRKSAPTHEGGVCAAGPTAPALDEDQASTSARSAPASLLHLWRSSGDGAALAFHAWPPSAVTAGRRGRGTDVDRPYREGQRRRPRLGLGCNDRRGARAPVHSPGAVSRRGHRRPVRGDVLNRPAACTRGEERSCWLCHSLIPRGRPWSGSLRAVA